MGNYTSGLAGWTDGEGGSIGYGDQLTPDNKNDMPTKPIVVPNIQNTGSQSGTAWDTTLMARQSQSHS
tara:strand:+ start:458 stop:661 length:204 start_codon:yes stop_codon:yes gene_type:complete